jgi:hypothetical protein
MKSYELATRPRNSLVPFIVDVYDRTQPGDAPRVVARCDSRDGTVWRTKGATVRPPMREIRAALAGVPDA